MNEKAEDLAFGRWPDILQARGMDASFFSGRNGPCPFCGGSDRYRWAGKKFGGVWVCSSCTEGKYSSGMSMLMKHMGYNEFREACDDVREFFGANKHIQPLPRAARDAAVQEWTPEKIERNRARMLKFWNEARPYTAGDPVDLYLKSRVPGLAHQLENLRFHPNLEYWLPPAPGQDRFTLLGKFPAMLAYAQGPDGSLVQLHKTYLTDDGHKADVPNAKKTDLGVGINSFAIRMMEPTGDTLGVSEGIETGIAGALLRGIPVWPCLNGGTMSEFVLPDELRGVIRKLVIFADYDELKPKGRNADGSQRMWRPGVHYAETLAQKARAQGLRPLIIRSAKAGDDVADYWKKQAA